MTTILCLQATVNINTWPPCGQLLTNILYIRENTTSTIYYLSVTSENRILS